ACVGELQPLLNRIRAQRAHYLRSCRTERALRNVLADQVNGRDQRLGLDGQQARGPRERVAIRLRIDLDHPVGPDLRIEDIRTGAEVDDVQQRDVLPQLLV